MKRFNFNLISTPKFSFNYSLPLKYNFINLRYNSSIAKNIVLERTKQFLDMRNLVKFFEDKPVSYTKTTSMHLADQMGMLDSRGDQYISGGAILARIDLVASHSVAKIGAGLPIPTRSMDAVHFMVPVKKGSILIYKSRVNRIWGTSMEIEVTVEVETNRKTKPQFCCSSLLTFVLVDGPKDFEGKMRLPQVFPETKEEETAFQDANKRRQDRLEQRKAPEAKSFIDFRNYLIEGKKVTKNPTYAEMSEFVLPSHANGLQTTFGGQLMAWMEGCCSLSAIRNSRTSVVTASSDAIQFVKPSKAGDLVIFRSIVTRSFDSSMEVYVVVTKIAPGSSTEEFTNDGFFTFVSVDSETNTKKTLSLKPETPKFVNELEKFMFDGAEARKKARREDLKKLVPPHKL